MTVVVRVQSETERVDFTHNQVFQYPEQYYAIPLLTIEVPLALARIGNGRFESYIVFAPQSGL
jgi:hypothetical protein